MNNQQETKSSEKPKKGTTFSVALGLLDYVNPITYVTISIIIATHIFSEVHLAAFILYCAGAVVSVIFGFTIPTVKVLVGLGKFEFSLPVNLVTYVNSGIFVSGSALFLGLMKAPLWVYLTFVACAAAFLYFIVYKKTGKFNPVAVLLGSFGYIMIYINNISRAAALGLTAPIVCFALAICLMIFLVCIGVFANLMNARWHWVIESTNISCQLLVLIGTIILYCR